MYHKKVTKKRHQDAIYPPEIQYMNIYKKSVPRLSCFELITDEFEKTDNYSAEEDIDDFHGDATEYDAYLDSQIKATGDDRPQPVPFVPQDYNGGYQTSFSLSSISFKPLEQLSIGLQSALNNLEAGKLTCSAPAFTPSK